jgi:hypothetical protein
MTVEASMSLIRRHDHAAAGREDFTTLLTGVSSQAVSSQPRGTTMLLARLVSGLVS